MINLKKGMTLAEILIVLGIVAVVATMGFTYAKKGTEKAYNMYVYTGYKGISDALVEAKYGNTPLDSVNLFFDHRCEYNAIQKISELLNATCENQDVEWGPVYDPGETFPGVVLTTPNKITYSITYLWSDSLFLITMKIPSQRYTYLDNAMNPVIETNKYYRFYYRINNAPFPIVANHIVDKDPNGNPRNRYPSLIDRPDLLPFYIDDGLVGRVRKVSNNNYTFDKIEPLSFRQAFCQTRGLTWIDNEEGFVDWMQNEFEGLFGICDGIPEEDIDSRTGVLKLLDPRKL